MTTSLGGTSGGGEVKERPGGTLERNAIGLGGVMMQSITHISPAIAALFFTQFVVSKAGEAAPLAYLIGVIIVLMLAVTLAQMARYCLRPVVTTPS